MFRASWKIGPGLKYPFCMIFEKKLNENKSNSFVFYKHHWEYYLHFASFIWHFLGFTCPYPIKENAGSKIQVGYNLAPNFIRLDDGMIWINKKLTYNLRTEHSNSCIRLYISINWFTGLLSTLIKTGPHNVPLIW